MSGQTGSPFLKHNVLLACLTSVCSSGFLLFGYDQGVMSGVVISKYWLEAMGNPSTIMVGTITALYDVGAIFGAIGAAFTAEDLGRKRTLLLGAAITTVGAIIMGSAVERIQFMVARIITGIGIGYITSVTPVYQSEVSAAAQRGWQVCCQLSTMVFGLMLAYWINYGMYFYSGDVQWRFPLLFQCVFAVYILALTIFLPDTPRWLMRHDGNVDRGLLVLSRLRGVDIDHVIVQREKDDIMEAISIEAQEEGSWGDLFKDNGIAAHKRFYLAVGIQFMQQMSGINIVTYYAPTLFKENLGMSQEKSLLMGCYLQLFYVFASLLTWWMIDRVGRRKLFISMALGMCVVLICEAISVAMDNPSASIAAVFFVFAFDACFTWGWMATVWLYPAEILPLKTRAKGAALAASADFLGNFLVVEITPPALQNIGYKTYIIFAVLNLVTAVIVWCFYPETGGQKLEEIDKLFVDDGWNEDVIEGNSAPLIRRMQWKIVRKAQALRVDAQQEVRRRRTTGIEDGSDEMIDGKTFEQRIENNGKD